MKLSNAAAEHSSSYREEWILRRSISSEIHTRWLQKGDAIHDTIRIKHGALASRDRKAISITAAAAAAAVATDDDDDTCDTASIIWCVVTLQGKLPISCIVAIRGPATKGREGGDAEVAARYIGGPIQALNHNKIL